MSLMQSSPDVATQSPRLTLAKAMAGAPLLSWQVRQWHQPASNGAEASRKRTVPHMQPPVRSVIRRLQIDYGRVAAYIAPATPRARASGIRPSTAQHGF